MKSAGSSRGTEITEIYKGNFIKNAAAKAKEFLKTSTSKLKKVGKNFLNSLNNQQKTKTPKMIKPGNLVSFQYNAKFKDRTRWDRAPLVIMLGPSMTTKGNFYGLNIHHLPMKDRVSIASFFIELRKKRHGKLTYNDIKPFMTKFGGSPVLRQYIFSRVKNKVFVIDEDMFLVAAAQPSEDMVNAVTK